MASVSKRCSVMAQSPNIVRVFLLSPANASGERMQMLLRPAAEFDLAQRVRAGTASLGEAFAFTSGLYFRGKLAYAERFARTPEEVPGVLVIAPGAGLVPAETLVRREQLLALRQVPVDEAAPRFPEPLLEASRRLAAALPPDREIGRHVNVHSARHVNSCAPG